jgi:hypothetical protein
MTSSVELAANTIASAFMTNYGNDPYMSAAQRLADQQMLLSPEIAARIADADRDVWVALLESELAELARVARTKDGEQRAGMLIALRFMNAVLTRMRESVAAPVPPAVAAVVRGSAAEAPPAGGAS